jgi:hypothetical protein
MISGIDIDDYKEDHPLKLYELADQKGKNKMVKIDGTIFKFGWLDGMYCNVYDLEGHQYTIAAYTDCVPLTKDHQEGV